MAGNWDNNAIPNASSGDARVEAGQTVRVGSFNSLYRGFIGGGAAVATLSATGRVEISDYLRVANASFADLYFFAGGFTQLDTAGLSTVSNLSSGLGKFGGAGGTTQLLGWAPSTVGKLDLYVLEGHTLSLNGAGTAPAQLDIRLQPGARLLNQGLLDLGGGQVWLQGTANINTLPVFDNSGSLTGSGSLGAVRFNNSGSVNVGPSGSLAFVIGSHSGSFSGGVNSTLSFGGLFAGPGHRFLAGSAVNSQGDVIVSRGSHQVSGGWNAARTFVQGDGQIDFIGPAPQIGELHLTSSGNAARFNSAGGATLQSVFIDNSFGRVERIRFRFTGLGKDSNGAPILVANATGEDQFGPYLDLGPVEVGVGTNVVIRYVVPDGVTLPDPIIRVDWPESLVAAFPSSTFVSLTPQGNPSGQRKLRFNTVRGWNYRVMGAVAVVGPWSAVSDAFPGNDSNIEWPIPPNLDPGHHFWRVEVTPQGD